MRCASREHRYPVCHICHRHTAGRLSCDANLSIFPTDLKRELISKQAKWEIDELNSPTALQRFGAPFRSERGEVPPEESELPILRFVFVHHVRDFPFLDKAKEKEFWQDKLQVVCLHRSVTGPSPPSLLPRKHHF